MKSNIPKHPCKNKCTDFKEEQCKTCLIPSNSMELESENDFLVGDKIIFAAMCNSVMEYQDCLKMFISQGLIRHATVAELQANRRLTEAEQALAEVS